MTDLTERVRDYLLPKKIVCFNECENAGFLLNATDKQIFLDSVEYCSLKKGGYIVFDFGKELHGGIRILNGRACTDIRIRFGESLSEAFSEVGKDGACNDHAARDFRVTVPMLLDTEYAQTGFRFVRIDNVGDGELKLAAVYACYLRLKNLPVGTFECDDEKVNEIYRTAARTLYLCMQNRLWDGIKRDRLVWIGDMHPETKGIFCLYGDHPFISLGLTETAEHTPNNAWMDNIPSYSLWWLAILCDYDFYCDKGDFTQSQLEYAEKLVDKISACVDEAGRINYGEGNGMFLNWETTDEIDLECANRGLMLWTLRKYVDTLARRGKKSDSAEITIKRLEGNSAFNGKSKSAAAIFALGYGVDERAKAILTEGGAQGFSTFMSYYIAQAVKACSDGETALNDMKAFYGGMLDRGATSFWESYEPDWLKNSGRIDELPKEGEKDLHSAFGKHCYRGFRLSLCHGWSCGPVQFLTENALGVKFVEAGGKKIKIQPDLMGLKHVKGAVPTAYGLVYVEHVKTADGVQTTYELPDGVTLVD